MHEGSYSDTSEYESLSICLFVYVKEKNKRESGSSVRHWLLESLYFISTVCTFVFGVFMLFHTIVIPQDEHELKGMRAVDFQHFLLTRKHEFE